MPIPTNAAFLFDMDSTLSDPARRADMLGGNPTDAEWNAFFMASGNDAVNESTLLILKALQKDYKIVILTGRSEIAREVTANWLQRHGVEYDALIMRQVKDITDHVLFKKEAYLKEVKPKYTVLGTFDDNAAIAHMWSTLGLTSYQQINP
jgi:hypothetical protein